MEGCVAEWQNHCVLGVHPHPPAPSTAEPANAQDPAPAPIAQAAGRSQLSARSAPPITPTVKMRGAPGPSKSRGRVAKPKLQAPL
jgi:hypothetical protein